MPEENKEPRRTPLPAPQPLRSLFPSPEPPEAALPPALPAPPEPPPPPPPPLPPAPPPVEEAARPKNEFSEKQEYEKKLAEMEKRLREEREKLLLATLQTQQEAVTSARVEVSIKELQDKLRRDRREQEQEEKRLKLEAKLQEMEARLAQERETWVATLKSQMQNREAQDKDIEGHFALRLQEMERRALEEKAQWQRVLLSKDEEIRNLRALAEKLKGADAELAKALNEKKWFESRAAQMNEERAAVEAKAQAAAQKEKEAMEVRTELALARQQMAATQEKFEREMQALRLSAQERENRFLADFERLRSEKEAELSQVRQAKDAEIGQVRQAKDVELGQLRQAQDAELRQARDIVEKSRADLQRMRAVCGALERQFAGARAQLSELQGARADWEKAQDRYKAEFVVLQRKWVEREKEIRAEAAAHAAQLLEVEKTKIKNLAQEEIGQRASKIAEQMQKEREAEVRRAEASLRAEIEREASARFQKTGAELERFHQEALKKESEWSQRLLAKESELHAVGLKLEDASLKLAREQEARQGLSRDKLEFEKALQATREESGALKAQLGDLKEKLAAVERDHRALLGQKAELERLAAAQAAQVAQAQEAAERMRGQLSREGHLSQLYVQEKERLEKQLDEIKREVEREGSHGLPQSKPFPKLDPPSKPAV